MEDESSCIRTYLHLPSAVYKEKQTRENYKYIADENKRQDEGFFTALAAVRRMVK